MKRKCPDCNATYDHRKTHVCDNSPVDSRSVTGKLDATPVGAPGERGLPMALPSSSGQEGGEAPIIPYYQKRNPVKHRAYMRDYMRKWRAKQKPANVS